MCQEHDHDYHIGGTDRDRLIADVKFYLGLLRKPIPRSICRQAYNAVRLFGRRYFAYTEGPDPNAPPAIMDEAEVQAP